MLSLLAAERSCGAGVDSQTFTTKMRRWAVGGTLSRLTWISSMSPEPAPVTLSPAATSRGQHGQGSNGAGLCFSLWWMYVSPEPTCLLGTIVVVTISPSGTVFSTSSVHCWQQRLRQTTDSSAWRQTVAALTVSKPSSTCFSTSTVYVSNPLGTSFSTSTSYIS